MTLADKRWPLLIAMSLKAPQPLVIISLADSMGTISVVPHVQEYPEYGIVDILLLPLDAA